MADNLLIVCTYTANSPYEQDARQMAASAAGFGYRVETIAVPDQGDWWRNVGIKPQYVLEALRKHNGPLLSLDADCLILKPLDELLALAKHADVLVKQRPQCAFSALFNAAVLMLNKTPASLQLVSDWAERGRQFAHWHRFSEQGAFAEGMLLGQRDLNFLPLPEKFHMFPEGDARRTPDGCVILHNKTSRKVRTSALPKSPPAWEGPPAGAKFVTIGPQGVETAGLPLDGAAGARLDFQEYASRFGIGDVGHVKLDLAERDHAGLERNKLGVWKAICQQMAPETRLVLCDFDTVFLGDPRAFVAPLQTVDMVLAWDRDDPLSMPAARVVGIKASAVLDRRFWPLVEASLAELRSQHGLAAKPIDALAQVLRSPACPIQVHCLPAEAVAELPAATRRSVAVSARSGMQFKKGDAAWQPHSHLSLKASRSPIAC